MEAAAWLPGWAAGRLPPRLLPWLPFVPSAVRPTGARELAEVASSARFAELREAHDVLRGARL